MASYGPLFPRNPLLAAAVSVAAGLAVSGYGLYAFETGRAALGESLAAHRPQVMLEPSMFDGAAAVVAGVAVVVTLPFLSGMAKPLRIVTILGLVALALGANWEAKSFSVDRVAAAGYSRCIQLDEYREGRHARRADAWTLPGACHPPRARPA